MDLKRLGGCIALGSDQKMIRDLDVQAIDVGYQGEPRSGTGYYPLAVSFLSPVELWTQYRKLTVLLTTKVSLKRYIYHPALCRQFEHQQV